ncbi:MAG: arylsulfatase [Prolixibacteraceae bacterium]|jgi:arylsulfatase|nr:arylsulfatase [Prolixibacteraceae bacterium]
MKQSVAAILLLGLNPLANAKPPAYEAVKSAYPGSGKPNVIVVLSDDQGYGDFSCHGNPVLKTPALDRLHSESIRFGNFHVSPLCTPTRGQLMTGLDAMRNGAATVLTGRNLLRRDIITMPEIFSKNGYATGIFGKWHLGDNYPDRPMDRGFQKCVWHKGWGLLSEIEFDNDYYETRYLDSLETKQSGEYCTNLWFGKAIEWMEKTAAKKQPFFTYLALNAPHGPFDSPAQDYNFYRNQVTDSVTACFLGMVRNIDRNMARLDEWLEKSGLKNNTLLVFMNDNGGTGGVELYNAGMRDKKGSNYEGGHRAACFMRWPDGNLTGGRTIADATQIQDLLPTFIDLCGLQADVSYPFDGKSLASTLLKSKPLNDRMFVVQYGGHVQPEKYFSCVVWDSWRLVGNDELYDLSADPGQKNNVAKMYPERMDKMQVFYENWWKEIEPGINNIIPVVVGSEKENPVIFNSDNWVDGAVNTQWKVAQAGGSPQGDTTYIQVAKDGKYKIELSRWPFHLQRSLTNAGPKISVGGTGIRPGKAVSVQSGCISLDNQEPLVKESLPNDTKITFELELTAGTTTFRGWFKDENGEDLCGAYYVKVERHE